MTRAGDRVAGRFQVDTLLGVGGMGSAWAARDTQTGADVVIKFHESGFLGADGQAAMRRFVREAQTLSTVHHDNVCRLITADLDPDTGEPFIVMERLRGLTLAARLQRERRLDLEVAFEIGAAVSAGLSAVHEAGVLHRDIKPENVFLHGVGDGYVPKIIDFGLARPKDPGDVITVGNVAVGTPGYMAPEQVRGKAVDERIDVYAVGVCLYELLAGALPFDGETAMDLAIATVRSAPAPLDERVPGIDPVAAEIVHVAMATDPDLRFGSAHELQQVLAAFLEGRVGPRA